MARWWAVPTLLCSKCGRQLFASFRSAASRRNHDLLSFAGLLTDDIHEFLTLVVWSGRRFVWVREP
jgi:hypothetical protein